MMHAGDRLLIREPRNRPRELFGRGALSHQKVVKPPLDEAVDERAAPRLGRARDLNELVKRGPHELMKLPV